MEQALSARWFQFVTLALLVCIACTDTAIASEDLNDRGSVAALRAKYVSLRDELRHSQFQRPVVLTSSDSSNQLKGDIYAVMDSPFGTLSAAVNSPAHWCDILILHLNTKHCHASTGSTGTVLTLNIGKKYYQALAETYRLDFAYRVAAATPDYLYIVLTAEQGPLGTRDYRIIFEAVPLDGARTFIHFTYQYEAGLRGRLAWRLTWPPLAGARSDSQSREDRPMGRLSI